MKYMIYIEDKELLLKDLCARLSYGVMVNRLGTVHKLISINSADKTVTIDDNDYMPTTFFVSASEIPIKPYLRPMSSMTEEEKKELSKRYNWRIVSGVIQIRYHSDGYWDDDTECHTEEYIKLFDWLNAHHFDYRGLIEKGLALETTKEMYG